MTSSEGALDPIGLFAIADALGVRLARGVRERQSHPRFLTAMSVGAVVCSYFEEDVVAKDGVSEPWQVFEWYMVEGLVRMQKERGDIPGLPGSQKARQALRDGVPLSTRRYLKTPLVFGFHGVYRTLALELDVLDGNRLGPTGYEIVTAWEDEQGLEGFANQRTGRGADLRHSLARAVEDGLNGGSTARSGGWEGWAFFWDHLNQHYLGTNEARKIADALLDPNESFRRQTFEFLISNEGAHLWSQETQSEEPSERRFHEALMRYSDPHLQGLIRAIMTYETFSRLLQDAFDESLLLMTRAKGRRTYPGSLAQSKCVQKAAREVPGLFSAVSELLQPFVKPHQFEDAFAELSQKSTAEEWISALLEHHRRVQKNKPPHGKNPWFETFDDGGLIVRPAYQRQEGGRMDDSYVYAYRTKPLWNFARDLRLVK